MTKYAVSKCVERLVYISNLLNAKLVIGIAFLAIDELDMSTTDLGKFAHFCTLRIHFLPRQKQ